MTTEANKSPGEVEDSVADRDVSEPTGFDDHEKFPDRGEELAAEAGTEKPEILYDIRDPGERPDEEPAQDVAEEESEDQPQEGLSLDDEIKGYMEEVGVSEEEAKKFSSVQDLEEHLLGLARTKDATPAEPAPRREAPAAYKLPELEKFAVQLKDQEIEPDIVKTFESMNEHYHKQAEDMRSQMQQLIDNVTMQTQAAFQERFDRWVTEVKDDYGEVLGTGPSHRTDQKSREYGNRVKLLEEANALAEVYAKKGEMFSEREILERAARNLFSDTKDQATRRRLSEAIVKRRQQHSHRPTQRRAKREAPETGDEAAYSFVAEKLKEFGIQ